MVIALNPIFELETSLAIIASAFSFLKLLHILILFRCRKQYACPLLFRCPSPWISGFSTNSSFNPIHFVALIFCSDWLAHSSPRHCIQKSTTVVGRVGMWPPLPSHALTLHKWPLPPKWIVNCFVVETNCTLAPKMDAALQVRSPQINWNITNLDRCALWFHQQWSKSFPSRVLYSLLYSKNVTCSKFLLVQEGVLFRYILQLKILPAGSVVTFHLLLASQCHITNDLRFSHIYSFIAGAT